jgi:hypothetical protein
MPSILVPGVSVSGTPLYSWHLLVGPSDLESSNTILCLYHCIIRERYVLIEDS